MYEDLRWRCSSAPLACQVFTRTETLRWLAVSFSSLVVRPSWVTRELLLGCGRRAFIMELFVRVLAPSAFVPAKCLRWKQLKLIVLKPSALEFAGLGVTKETPHAQNATLQNLFRSNRSRDWVAGHY